MKKILVTGFNAFGPVRINPSELIVRSLAEKAWSDVAVVTELLPTEYVRSTRQMKLLLRRERPDAVLCLGVATGRRDICLERIALNLDDEPLADNAGVVRLDHKIVQAGPPLYRSTLPLWHLLNALQRRRIRSRISNHAGTYLCNHIFFVVRHETRRKAIPAGFIHLPALKTGRKASMSLRTMQRAVECCIHELAANKPRRR
jgi:pyroglutamyl-peptidase